MSTKVSINLDIIIIYKLIVEMYKHVKHINNECHLFELLIINVKFTKEVNLFRDNRINLDLTVNKISSQSPGMLQLSEF